MPQRMNSSHLFLRMQRFFGRRTSPDEMRFRFYFKKASRSISPSEIKIVLEEMAWEVVKLFNRYSERKSGYDTVVNGNEKLDLMLPIDENFCREEIERILQEMRKKYDELIEACSVAHTLKSEGISDDPLDEHLLRSRRLRRGLFSAARLLGYDPSEPPFN